jgi:hypothetical protein
VIRGQILDAESGLPLRRAQVRAARLDSGETWATHTDGDGRYELSGLPAGRYRLGVSKDGYMGPDVGLRGPHTQPRTIHLAPDQVLERVDYRLTRAAAIAGHVVDEFGDPEPDVMVVALEFRLGNGRRIMAPAGRPDSTNDLGEFRISGLIPGRYYLSARPVARSDAMLSDSSPGRGYGPVYYPGTSATDAAQSLEIVAGQQLGGIRLALVPTRTFQILGTLRTTMGLAPTRSTLTLTRPESPIPVVDSATQTWPNGRFRISGVGPGRYVLNVRAAADSSNSGQEEFASTSISVVDSNVEGVEIATVRGATLSGTVTLDPRAHQRLDLSKLTVLATPVSGDIGLGSFKAASVRLDGEFELKGLIGSQLLNIQGLPSGWEPQSVVLNGRDMIDTPMELSGLEEIAGVTVTVTNRLTTLSGVVVSARSHPIADCVVLAFSDDSRLWEMPSRYIRLTRSDQNGRFEIHGLPPGRYMAVAAASLTQTDAMDPLILERVRSEATSFSMREMESKSMRLMPIENSTR